MARTNRNTHNENMVKSLCVLLDINNKQSREFFDWAFGRKKIEDFSYLHSYWNDSHRDLFFIDGDESVVDSLKEMYKIYHIVKSE